MSQPPAEGQAQVTTQSRCKPVPHRADGLRYVRVTQGWNELAAEAVDLPGPCVQGEHVTSVPEELHVKADPSQ